MAEILLEHFDGEAEFAAQRVKFPLAFGQKLDDLLTSGTTHLLSSTVLRVLGQPLVDWHIVDVQFLDHPHPAADPNTD